jgi:hypothetical protein
MIPVEYTADLPSLNCYAYYPYLVYHRLMLLNKSCYELVVFPQADASE